MIPEGKAQSSDRNSESGQTLGLEALARLTVILGIASLPIVFDPGAVARAAALYPLAASAHPYWVPSHAILLYLWAPLVVVSASILLLTPGLLLALAAGAGRTIALWIPAGLMLTIVVVSLATGVAQALSARPLVDGWFVTTVVGCSIVCLAVLSYRVRLGRSLPRPWSSENGASTLIAMLGLSLLLLIALAPKFYWDTFNGDGAHTFESARLLLRQPVPFWSREAGGISAFPGLTTALYLYPESWYIRLFGNVEAAVRIPWVLHMNALFCAIVALAEAGRSRLARVAHSLIGLALTVYAITLAYSATYSPYSADIALPATQDTLFMVMFLAYVVFFLEERISLMALALVLTYLSLPSGMPLIALWLVSVAFWRPAPWRRVILSLVAMGLCVFGGSFVPHMLEAVNLPPPGNEYAGAPVLRYLEFLQFTDWRRFAYVVVPGGIMPALALVAWKRHDMVGKSLVIVTLAYFALFFIQAHVALHHFVPAMILPIAIFWRAVGGEDGPHRSALMAVAAAGLVALVISLPRDARPLLISRQVGFTVEDRTVGYERSDATAFRRSPLLVKLFPPTWISDAGAGFGVSPLVYLYYAHHAPAGRRFANYVLQPLRDPAPDQMTLVAVADDAALYVRDSSVWVGQRAASPPRHTGSAIYAIPPETLFRTASHKQSSHVIDTRRALRSVGVDIDAIRRRLAGRR